MAKDLPYFKFYPGEWLTGDITICDECIQGVFINICCYYWMKQGDISLANAKQRFSKDIASINILLDKEILKVENNDKLMIEFLDEQLNNFNDISGKRVKAC